MSQKMLKSAMLLLSFSLLFSTVSFSQQTIKVTGKVVDGNNAPVNGASVVIKGSTGAGVIAGEDGTYTIDVSPNGTLIFSSAGFGEKEEQVKNRSTINLSLDSRTNELSDVVVIGYGTRQRRDINGAISTIKPKDIEKSTALTPELAMQGQMAGVNVTSAGGNPTDRPTVRIRGTGSINFSDPLYVIDGVPIVEGGAGATVDKVNDPTRRGGINLYTIINPNDIESISVLKDASAAAIYGVRAANGVVLITTKTGKRGRVRVDLDASYTKQSLPKKWDVLTTQQYLDFYNKSYAAHPDLDAGVPLPIWQGRNFSSYWNPSDPKYIGNDLTTYDWQDEIVNDNSGIQNYNLRVSGGSENTTYNFSAGYNDNQALFGKYNADRWSLSSNVTSKVGKYIETGANIRAIQQRNHGGGGDLDLWKAAPWQAIYDPNGFRGYKELYNYTGAVTPGLNMSDAFPNDYSAFGRQYIAYNNVFATNSINRNSGTNQTFIGSAYFQVQPINGLKIKGTVNGQQSSLSNDIFEDFDRWRFAETPNNPYNASGKTIPGTKKHSVKLQESSTVSLMKALNINYTKAIGQHSIDLMFDASEQAYKWKTSGSEGSTIIDNPDLNNYFGPSGVDRAYAELHANYALIGYLGRVSYNYASKYYLEGVLRRDGSSRFAPGHKWGTFPSGAASWRISQEDFFKGVSWINDLKLRVSYGVLGNEQTTGGWSYLSAAQSSSPTYNLGTGSVVNYGIAFSNFPNSDLTWEKLKTASAAIEATMFNNTVSVTVEYYNKLTDGIIQTISLTPSSGIQAPADINIANLKNQGFEFSVGYNKTFGQVGINLNANLTTVKNRITKLYSSTQGATALRSQDNSIEIGYPLGYIYGYKVGGIFQNQKEVDDYSATHEVADAQDTRPGDLYFQDLFGPSVLGSTDKNYGADGVINSNDQTYLGKLIPGYYYGFTAGANFKGFDLSIQFFGKGDVQKINYTRMNGESMNGNGRNQFASVMNAWTPTNTNTSIPRAVYGDPNNNLRFSDRFVENGAYLRLQNLQLGYNFDPKFLAKSNTIQNLRLYVSGINLFTATKYSGLDPENDLYPTPRQFQVGLKAGF